MIRRTFKIGQRVIVANDDFIVRNDQYFVPKLNQDLTITGIVLRPVAKDPNNHSVGFSVSEFLVFKEIGDYYAYPATHFRPLDLDFAETILKRLAAAK